MTPLQKYMVISLGYKDLVGIVGSSGMERIKSQIKQYNLYAILETCSKISITLLNHGTVNPLGQAKLLAGIFPDKRERIRFYEKARAKARATGSPWAIFNQQSILTLVKIALNTCPIKGGKSVDASHTEQFGYWLLIINDECFAEENSKVFLPSKEHERERLMKALARYQFFHTSERLGYKIGRFRWIVDYFKTNKPHGVDIEKLFSEATGGVPLNDYMTVCASLLVKWVRISTKKVNLASDWVTCPDVYFKKTKLKKRVIKQVLNMIAMLPQEFANLYDQSIEEILGGREQFHYNFMPLVWKPLVWYQDKKCFICPSVEYLFDKVTDGIYRTIETFLRNESRAKERDTFSIAWGEAFEQYINSCLSGAFGKNFHSNPTDIKTKEEMIDGVIDSSSFIFITETKNMHWSDKTMVTGNIEDSGSSLNQLFVDKGLAQIANCIKKCIKKEWKLPVEIKDKQFIPVLIVSESVPEDAYNRRLYEVTAEHAKTIVHGASVLPFIILTAEEIEILEAIATKRGAQEATQILAEYAHVYLERNEIGLVSNAISFKYYLFDKGYEKPEHLTNNQRLLKHFDDVFDDVCIKAFGRKIEKRRKKKALN